MFGFLLFNTLQTQKDIRLFNCEYSPGQPYKSKVFRLQVNV